MNFHSPILSQSSNNSPEEAFCFKFAVNSRGKDKNWDYKVLSGNFHDKEGTIYTVIDHVKQGHALCAGLLGGKWRAKKNVDGSWVILGDIDNSGKDEKGEKCYKHQLTLDEALDHPFLKQYCSLVYTTASHSPEWHKFRMVFVLPRQVDAEVVECLVRHLMKHFPQLDPACKDASRVFYGATNATFPLVQPNAVLPQDWIDDAIATAQKEREEYQQRIQEIEARRQQFREISDTEGWDTEQQIHQALSFIPPRSPGSGNYDECRQVLMALVSHYGPTEAEAVAEQWSPSIKGTTWNIRAKIRSFRRGGITVGTLFHIAKQYGFRFPERKQSYDHETRDCAERSAKGNRIITKGEWENHPNRVAREFSDFKELLQGAIAKITRKAKAFTGFGKQKQVLPALENGRDYRYKKEQRKEVWQSLVAKQWKYAIDRTSAGGGKSHTTGTLKASDFEAEKLFYLAADHRNPTTRTIEEKFTDLVTRHNGLIIDDSRLTPLGQPFRVTENADNKGQERTPATCHRSFLFNLLSQKNVPNIQSRENPICSGCPMSGACAHSVGDGYGFKYLRSQALKATELRAHPDSMPVPDDFPYENTGLIWDEAEVLFRATETISFSLQDIDTVTGRLYQEDKALLEKLEPLLKVLRSIPQSEFPSRYGWSSSDIKDKLPKAPEDLTDLATAVDEILHPDLSFLSEETDKVLGNQLDASTKKSINRLFRREALREDSKELRELPVSWLSDAIAVWGGQGSIRYSRGEFHITKVSDRHREIAKAAKFNLFLSATLRREDLALMLGVNPDEILVIECDRPSYKNLKVTQVAGLGQLGKDRDESMTARVEALKNALRGRHQDITFLDWKGLDESYHFRDGRGTNRFEKASALASVGIPFPDLGACKAEYEALGGEPDGFQSSYDAKVQAEILQEIGRLRAQLRPDEQLHYYFVGDYDLSFLKESLPEVSISTVEGFSIAPEAGTRTQKTRWAILQAAKQLAETGQKIGQQAIAAVAQISQGRVSQIAKEIGGWAVLKKLLISLVQGSSKTNNFDPPGGEEDLSWWAKNYLPLLLEEEIPEVILSEVAYFVTNYGFEAFEQVLGLADVVPKTQLLSIFMQHCLAEGR